MTILALEFSSPQRSAAVFDARGHSTVLAEAVETGGRSTRALSMIEDALRQAQVEREEVECVAVGLGPGSYTGIRAAISLAQGWQLASQMRVAGGNAEFSPQHERLTQLAGISSVESLAWQAREQGLRGTVAVVVDAQRNEFYLANYDLTGTDAREIMPLRLASLAEAKAVAEEGLVIGPEVTRWFPQGRVVFPRAVTVAKLAHLRSAFSPGERLEPIYLREPQFVKAPPAPARP